MDLKTDNTQNPLAQSTKRVEENKELLIPSLEKSVGGFLKKVSTMQAGDVIVHPTCKLCHHPLRSEAEVKWEQTRGSHGKGNISMVTKFLNDRADEYDGVKFNQQNVTAHLTNHYDQQMKRMWLRHYGQHLSDIMNYKIGKDEMFEGILQTLHYKLHETAANPDLDPVKQADMLSKYTKSAIEVVVLQSKLRGEFDTLDLYKEKFHQIIVHYIAEKDVDRQRELFQRLDDAKNEIEM